MAQYWIRVDSSLPTHHKIYALKDELKLKERYEAVGIVTCLWLWVSENAPNGDISKYTAEAIADAVGWRKKPQLLYDALVKVRFIEVTEDKKVIRNWERYAELLIKMIDKQKKKTNERVKRYRNKKKNENVTKCNVTETLHETENRVTVTPLQDVDVDNNVDVCNITAAADNITAAAADEKAFADVVRAYEQNIAPITQMSGERIADWLRQVDADVVVWAISEAVAANARNVKYIDKIISTHAAAGRTAIAAVQEHNRARANAKASRQEYEVYEDNYDHDALEQIIRQKMEDRNEQQG